MFVVGGTLPNQPPSELEKENLALIDIEEKTCFKTNLKKPVSRPACSISNKRLLFIAGGKNNGNWISDIQIYDIEHSKMYKTED